MLQNRNITSAIIGASRPDQVASKVKAVSVTLEAEILTKSTTPSVHLPSGIHIGQVPETREA